MSSAAKSTPSSESLFRSSARHLPSTGCDLVLVGKSHIRHLTERLAAALSKNVAADLGDHSATSAIGAHRSDDANDGTATSNVVGGIGGDNGHGYDRFPPAIEQLAQEFALSTPAAPTWSRRHNVHLTENLCGGVDYRRRRARRNDSNSANDVREEEEPTVTVVDHFVVAASTSPSVYGRGAGQPQDLVSWKKCGGVDPFLSQTLGCIERTDWLSQRVTVVLFLDPGCANSGDSSSGGAAERRDEPSDDGSSFYERHVTVLVCHVDSDESYYDAVARILWRRAAAGIRGGDFAAVAGGAAGPVLHGY